MKIIISVFLCLFSFAAVALPVKPVAPVLPAENFSFMFDKIKIVDLTRVVFSDVLRQPFIFDSEFLADSSSVSFNMHGVKKDEVKSALLSVLDRHGYNVTKNNLLDVTKKPQEEKASDLQLEPFFYRPKFRSVSYITDLVSALFKFGRFTTQSVLRNSPAPVVSNSAALGAGASASGNSSSSPAAGRSASDSGNSAFSAIDKEKDVFIFNGTAEEIEQLKKLLAQIDVSAGQVLVRAHVFEVTTGSKEGSAFALAVNLISRGAPSVPLELTKWAYRLGDKAKAYENAISIGNSTVEAVYSALASDNRFKVVSSPSLRVKSGENARFSVGSDVPVLGNVQMDKAGNPVSSVEYKASGVILDLKPKIRGEEIELQIVQQLSSFIPTTTGVNNSPTLIKREISTNISVLDGDIVVLGGLDESRNSTDTSGLPFLPAFLRSNGRDDSKTELLLVLETQKI